MDITCSYPNYCPPNSTQELICDLGYEALSTSGKRDSHSRCCLKCSPGSYGNHPQRLKCDPCPAGFFCPGGTTGPRVHPCPQGAFCPLESEEPRACPPGTRGTISMATAASDCSPCAPKTYQHESNKTACKQCGSSADSTEGQETCECFGKYRHFQVSDGSCECLSGYVFFDPVTYEKVEGNSDKNCQLEVWTLLCSGMYLICEPNGAFTAGKSHSL